MVLQLYPFLWVWNFISQLKARTHSRVFGNRVLMRIFGPKREIGEWRKQ
jgi:hypothetical protein